MEKGDLGDGRRLSQCASGYIQRIAILFFWKPALNRMITYLYPGKYMSYGRDKPRQRFEWFTWFTPICLRVD
jgi:hypothetical protein